MAGQTGHHHIEQLGVDKRQRIAQLLGIRLEPQLLGLLGRGERHIGLATKELGQVASRRVGADGIIGRSVHLKAIGTGDVTRFLARTRGARSTRRRLVRRDTGNELVDRARRRIHVNRWRHAQNAQINDIVGKHLGRSVGNRRAAQRGIALGKGRLAASPRHGRCGLERQRRAKVDQTQVKATLGELLVERQTRRAHHNVSGRDIAMDKALAHQVHAAQQIKQIATQARRHKRRQAPGIVYGES